MEPVSPDGRDWLGGKLGLVLMGGVMFNKSLIQLSIEGWGCVPSLLFDLSPNYGGGDEDNGKLLQKVSCMPCCTQRPHPEACHRWPTPQPETPGHSQQVWVSLLWGHSSFLLSPGVHKFVWALWASLAGMWFDSKCHSAPPTVILGLLLCPGHRVSFFGGIQQSPVYDCSAVSCNFGVLAGVDKYTSFYSAILNASNKSLLKKVYYVTSY